MFLANWNKKPQYPWDTANYPLDLDASMRVVRPAHGIDFFPYPSICGWIKTVIGTYDVFTLSTAFGKNAYGPGVASVPIAQQFLIPVPGISKVT